MMMEKKAALGIYDGVPVVEHIVAPSAPPLDDEVEVYSPALAVPVPSAPPQEVDLDTRQAYDSFSTPVNEEMHSNISYAERLMQQRDEREFRIRMQRKKIEEFEWVRPVGPFKIPSSQCLSDQFWKSRQYPLNRLIKNVRSILQDRCRLLTLGQPENVIKFGGVSQELRDYLSQLSIDQKNILLWERYLSDDLQGVDLLLQGGADVNASDEKNETLLFWAVRQYDLEAVALLLKYGALVDLEVKPGLAPYIWAFREGKEDIVKLLGPHSKKLQGADSLESRYSYALVGRSSVSRPEQEEAHSNMPEPAGKKEDYRPKRQLSSLTNNSNLAPVYPLLMSGQALEEKSQGEKPGKVSIHPQDMDDIIVAMGKILSVVDDINSNLEKNIAGLELRNSKK